MTGSWSSAIRVSQQGVYFFHQPFDINGLGIIIIATGIDGLSRSGVMAWAESPRTGISLVSGLDFNCLAASQPSITGRLISKRIKAGDSEFAILPPSWPSTAITTSYTYLFNRRDNMSRFISLSSTSKILVIRTTWKNVSYNKPKIFDQFNWTR